MSRVPARADFREPTSLTRGGWLPTILGPMGLRAIFLSILVLGLAVAVAWHASGAVSERDALHVAAAAGAGVTTSPPAPVTSRLLGIGIETLRALWAPLSLFRAAHLVAGFWLALAAGLSALVAARMAGGRDERPGAGLAAGLFVGAAVLFGEDTGGLGLLATPVPVLLALLAGSAAAFVSPRPRPLLGGLLLGLATAEHPFVLFLLPGFGALALGSTLRARAEEGRGMIRIAWFGFALGLAALFLPVLDGRGSRLLFVGDPDSAGRALAAWFGGPDGAFWHPGGPRRWVAGVLEVVFSAWRAAGPLGLVLGLGGLVVFFTGRARLGRPYLLAFLVPAAALVFGEFRDPRVAAALLGWTFLFWTGPVFALAWDRFAGGSEDEPPTDEQARRRADLRTPVTALLAGGLLFAFHGPRLDQSAERGIGWASTVLETSPERSVLLTANPIHVALAAAGTRPDVDVIYLPEPTSLAARRTGNDYLPPDLRRPTDRIGTGELQRLLAFCLASRPVLIDPQAYFDPAWREAVLAGTRVVAPHGLAFRVIEVAAPVADEEVQAATAAWRGVDPIPGTPPNPLREDLGGDEWFARGLLQSASLWVERDEKLQAEAEYLLALSHPVVNPNVAALGMARLLFDRRNWTGAAETLRGRIRDDLELAWVARRLLANSLLQAGRREEAREELRRALQLTPPELAAERRSMEGLLETLSSPQGPG